MPPLGQISLTPDELERLLRTARKVPSRQMSSELLGRRFGISETTVSRLLRQHGVVRPK